MSYATRSTSEKNPPRIRFGPEYQAEIPSLISGPYLRESPEILTAQQVENHCRPMSIGQEDLASLDRPMKAWTVEERERFVLGLYLFEKDFNLLKKFVGTVDMGDLLRFYYGEFYGSVDYRLWKECRKSKGRSRRFYGNRLFSKWRGDVILSRLSSLVDGDDLRAMLIQSSAGFVKKRLSFEEYVFELKGIVGIPALVKAIGFGTGINDLTRAECKPGKCTEITASVNQGSLTLLSDISGALNKHSELSEPQSRELFFKAVWPRLQARGWRSEKLENHAKFGLKNPTVFLVNGKRKFSRRLVMGKHYFNSIKAVLYEVASKPQMFKDLTLCTVADTVRVDEQEPAEINHMVELEAEENIIENGTTCIDSPKQVKEKSSSQSSLTNEPSVAPYSEETAEKSPVNSDSHRMLKPFDLNLPYVPTDSESEERPEKDTNIRQEDGNSGADTEMARVNDMCPKRKTFDLNVSYAPTDSGSDHENAECGTNLRQENDNSGVESGRENSVRSRATAKRVLEAFESDFVNSTKKKKRVQ